MKGGSQRKGHLTFLNEISPQYLAFFQNENCHATQGEGAGGADGGEDTISSNVTWGTEGA